MSKFNTRATRTAKPSIRATSAVTSASSTPDARTALGGAGYSREARSELFLALNGAFITEDSYHESGDARMVRVGGLARAIALEEGGVEWLTALVRWSRNEGNMRSGAVVVACEATAARVEAKLDAGTRYLVRAAQARADEPGEILGYWLSHYGLPVPNAIKKGVADGARDLYNEFSLLRYDTPSSAVRFGRVLDLVHPEPGSTEQAVLFRHAIERSRHWADGEQREIPEPLAMVRARAELESVPVAARRALITEKHGTPFTDRLKAAGATWEWVSGWLADGKGMTADVWETLIPTMGYMALLRNVRNFEKTGVSSAVLDGVAARLADPAQVARSRQFPMRFLSAYKANQGNLRFAYPLEQALDASLANVPALPGRTLIMVDLSQSMWSPLSARSDLLCWEAAAIFGVALSKRAEFADLVRFGSHSEVVKLAPGESVLHAVRSRFPSMGGTHTAAAVRKHYRPGYHDRVVIVTDEQHYGGFYQSEDPSTAVDAGTPLYTWNLGGLRVGQASSGSRNRHTFGGLSDAAFSTIPLIERGLATGWPWETTQD